MVELFSDSLCVRAHKQPQNEYIEQFRKRHGYRLDHFEKRYVVHSNHRARKCILKKRCYHSYQAEEAG